MKTRSLEPVSVRAEHSFLYEKVIHYTVLAWHVSYEMNAGFIWHNTKKEGGAPERSSAFFYGLLSALLARRFQQHMWWSDASQDPLVVDGSRSADPACSPG